jgi:glycerophosphoryl diester phosphodiesterase
MVWTVLALAGSIVVHGHRGARAVLPENTMAAFEHAIAAGADFIELDVAVTRDNVPVISHDPVLPESLCTGPAGTRTVREMTFEEVRRFECGSRTNPAFPKQKAAPGARIPSLDEVLALPGKFHFNIELKSYPDRPALTPAPDEFARLVYDVIRTRGVEDRALVQSFDFRPLRELRKIAPTIRISALLGGKDTRDWIEVSREAGGAIIIAPEQSLVTRERVEAAHKAGLKVIPWTVNEPADWQRLIGLGVDGIITDDPAALLNTLKRE